jgi:hypothetical protein
LRAITVTKELPGILAAASSAHFQIQEEVIVGVQELEYASDRV